MHKIYLSTALGLLTLFAAATLQAAVPSIYPGRLLGVGKLPGATQMTVADFNGDGVADLAVADFGTAATSPPAGGVWVFTGQAGGGYAPPAFYATASEPVVLAAGDLNGDGWPDIVTGNDGSDLADQISVLINKGDGSFETRVNYSPDSGASFAAQAIAVADATGDGQLDVVLGTSTDTVYVIPGAGNGTLDVAGVQSLTTTFAFNLGVLVADINSDSFPDVVTASCAGSPDRVEIFSGTAGGTFANAPDQSVPVGDCALIGATDANEDGVPDIAVASFSDDTVQVLLDTGGTLTDSGTTYSLPKPSKPFDVIRTADVDGDGHADILVPNNANDRVSVLYGKGDGSFEQPVGVAMGEELYDVAAVDANGDGRLDLAAINWHLTPTASLVVARNIGDRQFLSYRDYRSQNDAGQGKDTMDMASADFNGDGRPDVATTNKGDNTLSVLLNNGSGGFGDPAVLAPAGASEIQAMVAGDVDGDGDADIVTADAGGVYTLPGNGDGTFQPAVISTAVGPASVTGMAIGDVNGDGRPELAIAAFDIDAVHTCQGDGAGHWNCTQAVPVGNPNQVALVDLDGDDALDLIITTFTAGGPGPSDTYVYLGAGDGGFASAPVAILTVAGGGAAIAAGDVNSDGVPDLVIGAEGVSRVSVFTGKGDGTFNAAATWPSGITDNSQPNFVSLADINGDGAPDIIAANDGEDTVGVLINNGDGTFAATVYHAAGYRIFPLLTMDMDGDGLIDIVSASHAIPAANAMVSVYLHNHAPIVATAAALTIDENTTGTGTLTASDREGDALAFAIANPPAHGTVKLDAAAGDYIYTPKADYSGDDSFSATASDGLNASAPVAVPISVQAVTPPDDGDADDSAPPPPANNGDSGSGGSGGGGGWGFIGGLLLLGALSRRRK